MGTLKRCNNQGLPKKISDINPLTNQTSTKILPFKHHCRWLNRVEATSLMLKASFFMVQPRSATAGSISFLKSLRDVPHHEPLAVACARLLSSDAVSTCFQPSGNGWDILAMRSWFITNGIEGPKEDIQTGLLGCAFRLVSCQPHNLGKEQNKETMKVFKNEGTSKSSSEGVLTLNYAFGP